ncbi:MAG: hypothetical protein ABSF43_17195 [Rectinemataceae bacterium]|jgi:hypothetical protein
MRPILFFALVIVLAAASAPLTASPKSAQSEGAPRLRFFAELSAGPLIGIDRPIKGCSGGLSVGMTLPPFEGGIRAGAAYDATLDVGLLRFDLEIGLGSGLRAIVGGLIPLGGLGLPDPAGTGFRVPVSAAAWPNRFGIASTLAELPWRALKARTVIEVELVYTDYRLAPRGTASLPEAQALSGAAAFAAGVEATIAIRMRWNGSGSP